MRKIVDRALGKIIVHSCDITAEILGIPYEQAKQSFVAPDMRDLAKDIFALDRFLVFWEDLVSQTVAESDLLGDHEFLVRVLASVEADGLVTRIFIYGEQDFYDE